MKTLLLLLLLAPLQGLAESRSARLYNVGATSGEPVFIQKWKSETLPSGEIKESSTIEDASGKLVMTQTALFKGSRLISQSTEQLQTGESYEVEVQGKKIHFRTFKDAKGEKRAPSSQDSVSVDGSFLTGPVTENFIRENWDRLKNKETIKAQFGVLELEDTITFNFKKKKFENGIMVVEMRPANVVIRMALSPMLLEFRESDKKVLRLTGRTPLKIAKGGQLSHFDSEILYD